MSTENTVIDSTGKTWTILSENYKDHTISFKVIIIGDSGVGKSSLAHQIIKNEFNSKYNATIGLEYFSFTAKCDDVIVNLQIWDTCGQEQYRSIVTNFYRNSSLAVMVYSIDSQKSFNDIDIWLKELKLQSNPDAKVFLIGNKCDLEDQRKINKETAQKYANDYLFSMFCEASAKTGMNTRMIFIEAARILFEDYEKYKDKRIQKNNKTLGIKQKNSVNIDRKCNC